MSKLKVYKDGIWKLAHSGSERYTLYPNRIASVPDTPQNVAAVPGEGQATITWEPPTTNGGSTVLAYNIGRSDSSEIRTVSASVRTYSWDGLVGGTTYSFLVQAVNEVGSSAVSTSNSVTPTTPAPGVPTSPRNVVATAGQLSASISWQAPSSDGGSIINSYIVGRNGSSETRSVSAQAFSYNWTGLSAGTAYSFTVRAVNAVGASPSATSNEVTPTAVVSGTSWWGWDPESSAIPPLLPDFPFHDNTGLWTSVALTTHTGNFTTSYNGQVIDRLNITGQVYVQHTGVVIKRCRIGGRIQGIDVSGVGQPKVIHCDVGITRSGDFKEDGTKYAVSVYRCNMYGLTDHVKIWGNNQVIQDNFFHDARFATDTTQSAGKTHNDCVQCIGAYTATIRHNTFFCWGIDNYSGSETCTRSSGPNWYNKSGSQQPGDGYTSSGIQINGAISADTNIVIENNLFRGHAAWFINAASMPGKISNNHFASDEQVLSRRPRVIAGGTSATKTGNIYWSGDPLAGQPIQ